jgi:translocation and assembly module TamB
VTEAALPGDQVHGYPVAEPPRRRRWLSLLAKTAVTLLIAFMLMIAGLALLLDTDFGHRLILDRIAAMAPDSGLRIRIGRLEGSIWGRTELKDVRLYDPEGLFAEAPRMELEWRPLAWLAGRLLVDDVHSDLVIVHRLPQLESDGDGTMLPDDDIHVGRLEIEQLRYGEGAADGRRSARITGQADFRGGRALLDLDATMRGGGDRLALLVDAAPDRDQFDLDVRLDAPADGVIGELFGTAEPISLEVGGDGSWSRWNGAARIEISGRPAGDLGLIARSGRYAASGWLAPAPLLPEGMAPLAAPRLSVDARAALAGDVLGGALSARSSRLQLLASGRVDLRRDRYEDVRLAAELAGATQVAAGVEASGLTVRARLDGHFAEASVALRMAAERITSGGAAFEGFQASGTGRLSSRGLAMPVAATLRRASSTGADGLLSNLGMSGAIFASGGTVHGRNFTASSERLRGRFAFDADLGAGRYSVAGSAAADRHPLEGIGLVDLSVAFRAWSPAAGAPVIVSGEARAQVRRLDNELVRWAAQGPPRIEAKLASGAGGGLHLADLRMSSPSLRLSGGGTVGTGSTLLVEARGRHSVYGPVALRLGGTIRQPRLGLRLARPSPLLSNLALEVEPAGEGFGFGANGDSPLGPFTSRGSVATAGGGGAAIRVAALTLSGASASGLLRAGGSGVDGRLDFRGALAGPVLFATAGGGQRVEAHLVASDARLAGAAIGSGRLDAAAEIGAGGALRGSLNFRGAADRLWNMAGLERVSLSGPLVLDAELGGSLSDPDLRGSLILSRGRLASGSTGTAVDQLEARGRFAASRLTVDSFAGRTRGGGRVRGSGSVDFSGPLAFAASIQADEAQLFDLPGFRARVSGPVDIRWASGVGSIGGTLRVEDAEVRLREPGGDREPGGTSSWRLALTLSGERLKLSGRGLDSEWRTAALRLSGTLAAPALTGEAALRRGTYALFRVPFELSDGTAWFEGESPPDPRLDILARPPAGLPLGAVRIMGRAGSPQIGPAAPRR